MLHAAVVKPHLFVDQAYFKIGHEKEVFHRMVYFVSVEKQAKKKKNVRYTS